MKPIKIILSFSLILIAFGISSADIYKWVDENGVTHYSDSPTSDEALEESESHKGPEEAGQVAAPVQPAPTAKQQDRNELMKSITKLLEDSDPPVVGEKAAPPVELYVTDT